jgi:hypothetical protein
MSGAAPHAPAPAAHAPAATAGHEKPTGGRLFTAAIPEWSWKQIKNISGGIWKRVKAVTSATWGATGGQIGAEFREVANLVGLPAGKEKGFFGPIASIIGSTGRGIKNVFKGLGIGAGHAAATPFRVVERGVRGVGGVLTGAWSGSIPTAANDNHPVTDHDHGEEEHHAQAA